MDFKVKASTKTGRTESLVINARSAEAVSELLKRQEMFPLEIEKMPFDFGAYFSAENLRKIRFLFNRTKYLIEFSRVLAMLIKSGMSLNEALAVLSEKRSAQDYFTEIICGVKNSVDHGISFSLALARRPDVFEDLYVKTVASGETSGNLCGVLSNLSEYYQKKQALYKKLIAAATYPAVILVLSTIGVSYLFLNVVPTYTKMFREMGASLPPISQVVFFIGDFVGGFYLPLGFLAAAFAFMLYNWLNTEEGKCFSDKYSLKIPLIRSFVEKSLYSIFYRTSGLLIKSGINIVNALEVSSNVVTNGVINAKIKEAVRLIREGNTISFSFEKSGFASDIIPKLIKTGEESGTLSEIFNNISNTMDEELDSLTTAFESLFGPLILIFVLAVFGTIIIAILLPMITAATIVS
ncbi:MAG TPA: type II secretion system F family protein [Candidatus Wallbacteria bacterium]|nr:MAG: Type II secretion system protein F [bacterium ADurb.Bin243]HOD39743.1 type II secretion system F family protein [Candidatus Wallbacteria bacterium]HPG57692.1 type II secretion system F family protein [Candidatus Wallbacteria bacterium]